jgi:hypothetical protein
MIERNYKQIFKEKQNKNIWLINLFETNLYKITNRKLISHIIYCIYFRINNQFSRINADPFISKKHIRSKITKKIVG